MGFPGKESDCNAGVAAGAEGSIPGSGRFPGEGNDNQLQYSCLEKSHGQRSLMGYSPQGCKRATKQQQQTWFRPDSCLHLAPLSGEGNGTPLQYSCLENPMDGGVW